MTCSRMEHDGMRYLDGEMTPEERLEFEGHLEQCETCRNSLGAFRELDLYLRVLRGVDEPLLLEQPLFADLGQGFFIMILNLFTVCHLLPLEPLNELHYLIDRVERFGCGVFVRYLYLVALFQKHLEGNHGE